MRRISPMALVGFGLVWWVLSTPPSDAWIAGGIAIFVAMALHIGLGGSRGSRVSIPALLRFAPWFVYQSLRGGADVARRAFSPLLPLDPAFVLYRIRLPDEGARIFFTNSISLLPGTFSARIEGPELCVHLLADSPDVESRLRELEDRVAAVFRLRLEAGAPE